MLKVLSCIIICFLVQSCCDIPPKKETNLNILFKKEDINLYNGINKIYAVGSKSTNYKSIYDSLNFKQNIFSDIKLPLAYYTDSTIYIIENKTKNNDTLIIHYNRKIEETEDACNFNVILSENIKPHYISIKNYKAEVRFGTFIQNNGWNRNQSQNACTINIYPKN